MKISKFVWSVLVAFATVASIAPQQVEAIIVDGRVSGQTVFTGSGTITESNGLNSNGINSNGISGSMSCPALGGRLGSFRSPAPTVLLLVRFLA